MISNEPTREKKREKCSSLQPLIDAVVSIKLLVETTFQPEMSPKVALIFVGTDDDANSGLI